MYIDNPSILYRKLVFLTNFNRFLINIILETTDLEVSFILQLIILEFYLRVYWTTKL